MDSITWQNKTSCIQCSVRWLFSDLGRKRFPFPGNTDLATRGPVISNSLLYTHKLQMLVHLTFHQTLFDTSILKPWINTWTGWICSWSWIHLSFICIITIPRYNLDNLYYLLSALRNVSFISTWSPQFVPALADFQPLDTLSGALRQLVKIQQGQRVAKQATKI